MQSNCLQKAAQSQIQGLTSVPRSGHIWEAVKRIHFWDTRSWVTIPGFFIWILPPSPSSFSFCTSIPLWVFRLLLGTGNFEILFILRFFISSHLAPGHSFTPLIQRTNSEETVSFHLLSHTPFCLGEFLTCSFLVWPTPYHSAYYRMSYIAQVQIIHRKHGHVTRPLN